MEIDDFIFLRPEIRVLINNNNSNGTFFKNSLEALEMNQNHFIWYDRYEIWVYGPVGNDLWIVDTHSIEMAKSQKSHVFHANTNTERQKLRIKSAFTNAPQRLCKYFAISGSGRKKEAVKVINRFWWLPHVVNSQYQLTNKQNCLKVKAPLLLSCCGFVYGIHWYKLRFCHSTLESQNQTQNSIRWWWMKKKRRRKNRTFNNNLNKQIWMKTIITFTYKRIDLASHQLLIIAISIIR